MSKKGEIERVDADYETRMAGFEVDCNDGKGNSMACHQVGEFYSVVKDDHARAAAVYDRNCNSNGYSASCFNLGRFFLGGRGVKQSDTEAERMFEKACQGDHLYGCYNLAMTMYMTATESKQKATDAAEKAAADERTRKALQIFADTCNKGEIDSCYFTAQTLIDPARPERNPLKAKTFFERACDHNHAPSCFNLAVLYKKGEEGVPQDLEKFEQYKLKTEELIKVVGIGGKKIG